MGPNCVLGGTWRSRCCSKHMVGWAASLLCCRQKTVLSLQVSCWQQDLCDFMYSFALFVHGQAHRTQVSGPCVLIEDDINCKFPLNKELVQCFERVRLK